MMRSITITAATTVLALSLTTPPASAMPPGHGTPLSPHPSTHVTGGAAGTHHLADLTAVTSLSAKNAWAVGYHTSPGGDKTLIEHWNGVAWTTVPSPNPGGVHGTWLSSIDAVSAKDIWAVGNYGLTASSWQTLVVHWDGSTWKQVASPHPAQFSTLSGVSVVSSTDVMAVGDTYASGYGDAHTLVLRWDGRHWSVVTSQNPSGTQRAFSGVSMSTAHAGWAVGWVLDSGQRTGDALAEHWNGTHWTPVAAVNPGAFMNQLSDVDVVGPGNAWAVGYYMNGSHTSYPLVEHLVSGAWTRVRVPGLGAGTSLLSVSGRSATDIWAVGYTGGRGDIQALILHWDGHVWHRYAGPKPAGVSLDGVTAGGPSATRAVGRRSSGRNATPVEERWNGHQWVKG